MIKSWLVTQKGTFFSAGARSWWLEFVLWLFPPSLRMYPPPRTEKNTGPDQTEAWKFLACRQQHAYLNRVMMLHTKEHPGTHTCGGLFPRVKEGG
jgi:hypothetical protein